MLSRPNMKHPPPPLKIPSTIYTALQQACLLASQQGISQYSVWMINARQTLNDPSMLRPQLPRPPASDQLAKGPPSSSPVVIVPLETSSTLIQPEAGGA